MNDKELWPIVMAAAEGKRVEWYAWGRWRTRPPGDGFLTGVDYRIAPHDCDKDGHEWKRETYRGFAGEAGLWVDEKCEHCPATRRERFALDPTPPPPAPPVVFSGISEPFLLRYFSEILATASGRVFVYCGLMSGKKSLIDYYNRRGRTGK